MPASPLADLEQYYQRAEVDGIRTAYLDKGEGKPIVLLHGSGAGVSALANWFPTVGPLSGRFRVICPDLVGFGRSERGPRQYGTPVWVAHVLALIDHLGLERICVAGNSMGGHVAIEFARSHPDRTRRVILMGTGFGEGSVTTKLREHHAYEPTVENMRRNLEGMVVDKSYLTDELVNLRFRDSVDPAATAGYKDTVAGRNEDRRLRPINAERYGDMKVETMIIHGREDAVIPVQAGWEIVQTLPNADLVVLSGAGHWTQIERASMFNALVSEFFGSAKD